MTHQNVTGLLREVRGGNINAKARLLEVVYHELHGIAKQCMAQERWDHTLQATALVNEAYLRLLGNDPPDLQNRRHFFAAAAKTMRRILVDYARAHRTDKRGGDRQRVNLEESTAIDCDDTERLIVLDSVLAKLAELDRRQSQIVELRFFVGLTEAEIAELLSISERTVKREWRSAKAWLYTELGGSCD